MLMADSSYPLADVLWTMLVFFGWVMWIWLLVLVYSDLFRRDDIHGWGKTGWVVFTIVVPFIGVFVYLIAEGRAMESRRREDVRQAQAEMDSYVRSVATTGSSADQIAQAKQLLDTGAITPDEYNALKQKALAA